jgi:ABC-type nickel/cobalt efflux system permease component RcnA
VTRAAAFVLWAVCLPLLGARSAAAHPLGNFTINHLARVRATATELRVHYVLDIAEIPAFQIMHAAGAWTPLRMRAWAREESTLVANGLQLTANGVALPLQLERTSARTRPGAGGLPILYWTADYTAPLSPNATLSLRDSVYADRRIGWKDIILPGLIDPTNELRSYPSALIGSPRRNDVATFNVIDGRVTHARVTGDEDTTWGASSIVRSSALSDLVARDAQTPVWVLFTVLAAFGLGALHGLEPGHGKALLAFTLVGARATLKQAAILAAALTFAHTIAVVLLGVLLCFAAGFATEALFTWITLISGVAVAFIGARSLRVALTHAFAHRHGHEHHHAHDRGHEHLHAIPGAAPLHFRSAVVAAMSGGIAPCPAAIVVLLTALHLHRVGYGLALIVIFSLGLATALSGLGVAVVHGAAWLGRRSGFVRFARLAPFFTAAVISAIGALMLAQGLIATGIRLSAPTVAASVLIGIAIFAFFPALLSTRSAHRTLIAKETT